MNPNPACLSDLELDQVAAGIATDGRRRAQRDDHLARCSRCRARVELFTQASEIAAPAVEQVLARARDATPRAPADRGAGRAGIVWPRLALAGAVAAGVAVAVVLVAPQLRDAGEQSTPSTALRSKGTGLRFYVKRGEVVRPGISGARFREGDALRFVVSSNEPGYLLIVGVEHNGHASAYYPYRGIRSERIDSGTDVPLPGSLILDDSRETEYILAIFSAQPVTLEQVHAALVRVIGEAQGAALDELEAIDLPGHHHWIVIGRE